MDIVGIKEAFWRVEKKGNTEKYNIVFTTVLKDGMTMTERNEILKCSSSELEFGKYGYLTISYKRP